MMIIVWAWTFAPKGVTTIFRRQSLWKGSLCSPSLGFVFLSREMLTFLLGPTCLRTKLQYTTLLSIFSYYKKFLVGYYQAVLFLADYCQHFWTPYFSCWLWHLKRQKYLRTIRRHSVIRYFPYSYSQIQIAYNQYSNYPLQPNNFLCPKF